MTDKLQQTIEEQIAELPIEMQEGIKTVDWVKTAEQIGTGQNLTEEEIEDFQLETLLVLIGSVNPEYYATNIENQAVTTKEKAEALAKEAFEKIFKPISKIIEEKVKAKMQDKKLSFEQNLNFVLSNGDYSTLLENPVTERREFQPKAPQVNANTILDLKNRL